MLIFFKKFFQKTRERETAKNNTPVSTNGGNTPTHQTSNIKTFYAMNKKQALAKITSISVPDALKASNEALQLRRARLTFRYNCDDEADDSIQSYLQKLDTRNNEGSLLIELGEKKLTEVQEKLVGQSAIFTTYTVTISELFKGTENEGETAVNNGERTYTSFSNSYIGKNDDADDVMQRMRDRLIRDINDKTYNIGELKTNKKKDDADEDY